MAAPSTIPRRDYSEQWRRYKKFKRLGLLMMLGWIPVLAVYILLVRKYESFPLGFLGFYLLLGCVTGIYQAFWPCPRCGQSFSDPWRFFLRGSGYDKGIARNCVHCGLPRFANNDGEVLPLCRKCGFAAPGKFCSKCGTAVQIDSGATPGISNSPLKPPQV